MSTFLGVNEIRDERDADGSAVTPVPVGTRKNVRIVKLDFTGTGSVLDAA